MGEKRWEAVKRIVDEALDEPDPDARRRLLDSACAGDAELLREIEALLVFENDPRLRESVAADLDATGSLETRRQTPEPLHRSPERFPPGTILSGRYRVIDLIGKGGMGEVYHAQDLALEQEVALKFLPAETAGNAYAESRFRREVRTARQISHPNVCRVHDFDKAGGFISMEYIRGEDLQSLLRRIGRLPTDKAIEIAVQIASGLAVAHSEGVLHRDLKPANVMLDELGRVRLMDFGLAAVSEEIKTRDIRSGTPGYMAPEQARGEAVTEASDLYALGLVVYELLAGEPPFAEPPDPKRPSRPRPLATLVRDIDPGVAAIVQQCLEPDPASRPNSAAAVRDRLPGGDRLAAVVARGETPARALVAEAGSSTGVSPSIAWTALLFVLGGVATVLWLGSQSRLTGLVPLPKSPELLVADARRVLTELGYASPQRDSTFGFVRDGAYIDTLEEQELGPDWWERLSRGDPGVIRFWYRESPAYLVPQRLTELFGAELDPPQTIPGMVRVRLDTRGRLRELRAVPPLSAAAPAGPESPAWETLFAVAGFERSDFTPAPPRGPPRTPADARVAWEGVYPAAPEVPIRIEASALGGRVVDFSVIEPWSASATDDAATEPRRSDVVPSQTARLLHVGADFALVLALLALAWKNLRSGRGDRELAMRLAVVLSGLVLVEWLLAAHHVPERSQLQVLYGGLYRASLTFVLTALLYLVLEPYARKLWPRALVSWVRLLGERFKDPVVGRDVLAGCVYGVFVTLAFSVLRVTPRWLGRVPVRPDFPRHPAELIALRGVREALAELLAIQVNIVTHVLFLFVALLVLRLLFRRTWIAVAVHWLLYVLVYGSGFGYLGIAISITGWHLLFFRFGWLAIVVGTMVADVLLGFPLTTDPSSWHAYASTIAVAVAVGLALYGFKVAIGNRPAFRDLLDAA